ncbi:uncharacterized protein MONBRDRAFT_25710 [Monosiga brevicollis MX1]|uniref:Uncharacterized protein n=1 Tax=Monosiga brevicollis TaxID=81824 RepID=A9V072_MONBE|nr:uncharacterized protein MONBRDRAFT_25710 [Monosiga brevicollis MX1]EDQ89107.1 predicted protein [Monosiga brevicollis MX1]|eukprot:XP_001746212.1 hypothetical protein [Monosiga brevicollis MX1]
MHPQAVCQDAQASVFDTTYLGPMFIRAGGKKHLGRSLAILDPVLLAMPARDSIRQDRAVQVTYVRPCARVPANTTKADTTSQHQLRNTDHGVGVPLPLNQITRQGWRVIAKILCSSQPLPVTSAPPPLAEAPSLP